MNVAEWGCGFLCAHYLLHDGYKDSSYVGKPFSFLAAFPLLSAGWLLLLFVLKYGLEITCIRITCLSNMPYYQKLWEQAQGLVTNTQVTFMDTKV